ncbi:hypothetical protein MMC30_009143 [Trapelia coarctata]|nr:hypothetical protein [Trapelia coarctata]
MRLRVYQFLLPDKSIPARFGSSKNLRTDGERAHITILRVNRQIHDEATALLYSTRVFAIGLSGTNLSMCNKFFHTRSPENGNHTLLDYQMQLMLLEQQNKRRLLQARLGQAALNGASSLSQRSGIPNVQTPFRSPIHYENDSIDSVWLPPISDKYFNMIRSFLLEVVFPSVRGPLSQQSNYRAHPASNTDATIHKTVELRLYDYCDSLHRVIGRLQLIQRPIAHLQIIVKLNDNYLKREEALSAAQLLLRPFRRLHSVGTPKVLSLTMRAFPDRETELLIPSSTPSAAEVTVTDFLKCWSRDLSSAQSSCQSPEVFEAYWKLEKLVATIKEHCFDTEPTFEQFVDLLHSARIAREADDLAHFTEIWDRVVNIWFDYLSSQRDFQSKVARSIEDIYEMVGKGRYTHKRPGEDGGWLGMQL